MMNLLFYHIHRLTLCGWTTLRITWISALVLAAQVSPSQALPRANADEYGSSFATTTDAFVRPSPLLQPSRGTSRTCYTEDRGSQLWRNLSVPRLPRAVMVGFRIGHRLTPGWNLYMRFFLHWHCHGLILRFATTIKPFLHIPLRL